MDLLLEVLQAVALLALEALPEDHLEVSEFFLSDNCQSYSCTFCVSLYAGGPPRGPPGGGPPRGAPPRGPPGKQCNHFFDPTSLIYCNSLLFSGGGGPPGRGPPPRGPPGGGPPGGGPPRGGPPRGPPGGPPRGPPGGPPRGPPGGPPRGK